MRGSAGPAGSTLELLDEDAARAFLEHFRWPNGPVCPHCGSLGAYRLHPKAGSTAPVRNGVLKCKACRRQFTVTVGTAFERSHVPLSTWLVVIRRLCESGQALSAYQLHKLVGVSRQSAWLMVQRIREAIALRAGTLHADPRVSNLDEKVAPVSTQVS
jgi:transposase-like protein